MVDYPFLDHLGFTRRERSSFNHRGRLLVFGSFGFHKKRTFFLQSPWSTIGFWIIWVSQEENVLPSIIVVDYWFLDHLGFTRRERSSFIVVDYLFLDHLDFTKREPSSLIVVDYSFLDHLGFTRRECSSFIMVDYWFLDHLGFTNLRDIECIMLVP